MTQNITIAPFVYQSFFENSSDAMLIADGNGKIIHSNNAFFDITGYDAHNTLNKELTFFISSRHNVEFLRLFWSLLQDCGFWQGEIWNKRCNGEDFLCSQKVSIIRNAKNQIAYYTLIFSKIVKFKKSEYAFLHFAHSDNLTGLGNRRFLEQRLLEEISAANRSKVAGALLVFDLDNFKKIAASLGHKIGEQVLKAVAKSIRAHLRTEDVFCRLGGDEFVILFGRLSMQLETSVKMIGAIIHKIITTLREPLVIAERTLYITASFGVTFFPVFADTPESALKQADIAMYSAKRKGKNTYCFYHPLMQNIAYQRLDFETDLRNAMRLNHFHLVYQPQYNHEKKILGYEVLVRWLHPEKGYISPAEFIPMAEEAGLIIELGTKILLDACNQLNAWLKTGILIPKLSINISPYQFHHDDFVGTVTDILALTRVDPRKITLEITENVVVQNLASVTKKMHQLKDIGLSFSIDDFGTGYSSLAYLKEMPIDQLKIDRSFVKDILTNSSDATIVNTIINMAQQLGLDLIAEGVEHHEQVSHLFKNGCLGFQGYCLSKPLEHHQVV